MKEYHIVLKVVSSKKITVRAQSADDAIDFVSDMFDCTDALNFSEEDVDETEIICKNSSPEEKDCYGCCEDCDSYCEINGTCMNPNEAGMETPCMECAWYCEHCEECTFFDQNG